MVKTQLKLDALFEKPEGYCEAARTCDGGHYDTHTCFMPCEGCTFDEMCPYFKSKPQVIL